ncbi:hypothetical protein JTE90_027016 [Oedothorax gibbosus]|uniref:Uncharacterized protein n=1 Tax=Oedothorax gibbosus TaxID=931172 RepID=A0AAV6V9H4_9ARAC|nr:hypothetical protein JTE90_027016 [Oedothorax gibbosus]
MNQIYDGDALVLYSGRVTLQYNVVYDGQKLLQIGKSVFSFVTPHIDDGPKRKKLKLGENCDAIAGFYLEKLHFYLEKKQILVDFYLGQHMFHSRLEESGSRESFCRIRF